MEAIAQVIKGQDIQQDGGVTYSLNEEESQEAKDGPAFTKCLAAVTEHVFPKKSYKMQKKYIWNICKSLRLGSCKWILQRIKLNDYLVHFPALDRVTATKISCEEFVDVLEDRISCQWKLEFEKEGFDLSSAMLKEFLDVCIHLEEAELQKLLGKNISCAKKEHDNDIKGKH
eukprot:8992041-Ditylum_brightwellii.AAC.1